MKELISFIATRLVDDPNTPDTGPGTPPIVDMGAYELGAPGPDPHWLPVEGDSDKDFLTDDEERGIGYDPENRDEDSNGVPDGVDLARELHAIIAGLEEHQPPGVGPTLPAHRLFRVPLYADCEFPCPICLPHHSYHRWCHRFRFHAGPGQCQS